MGNKAEVARQRIIDAADILFYQRGFEQTSFTDIACEVNMSRGNFYYHFKTKNEILNAVIQSRLDNIRNMLADWEEKSPDPRQCLSRFIDVVSQNHNNIQQYGCPVGSLCAELAKIDHAMHGDASHMFSVFRKWLIKLFNALGYKKEADQMSMQLLASTQGIAIMMGTFVGDGFYKKEVKRLQQWIAEL